MHNEINPGIRNVVAWLQAQGFNTTDSGDGKTNVGVIEGALDYPHVIMTVVPADLILCADRLVRELGQLGVEVEQPGGEGPWVEASYDPVTKVGLIALGNFDDESFAAPRFMATPHGPMIAVSGPGAVDIDLD
jgi:hypothetical protein